MVNLLRQQMFHKCLSPKRSQKHKQRLSYLQIQSLRRLFSKVRPYLLHHLESILKWHLEV